MAEMTHEEMAAALRKAGWRVQQPLTQENCPHINPLGSAGQSVDGSGFSETWCTACGKRWRNDWPARAGFSLIAIIPRNQPEIFAGLPEHLQSRTVDPYESWPRP